MDILIIEDETDILNGMQESVSGLDKRIDRVFAVGTSEAALEIIEEHHPDIIVTDIVLPQMTGLDLMEQIMDGSYHPKVIVISGFSNFSYAQRSIKLGAVDYMLKPFAKQEFTDKILSVIDSIYDERELNKVVKQDPNSLLGTKTLRDKYILGLCTNPVPLNENTMHRLKFFDMEWLAGGAYSIIALDRVETSKQPLTENEIELNTFAIGNVVEEILLQFPPSLPFRNIHHQWVIITANHDLEGMTTAISEALLRYQYIKICIGISNRMNAFQAIAIAYEEAVQAMKLARVDKQGHILYYSDNPSIADQKNRGNDYEQMAQYVYLKQAGQMEAEIGIALDSLTVSVGSNNRQALVQACVDWIVNVHAAITDQLKQKLEPITIQLWVDLDQCDSYGEIKAYMVRHFAELSLQLNSSPLNPIIEKAVEYMTTHYATNLTLQGVATELAVHPVWLSQLFKRETHVTFSHYLTDLRVEEAKRLLRETHLKIYEIAERVGYTDLQHFGQVFKKRSGTTPKEYRQGP
ncbi:response regulator [Paenibacillus sp. PAMC21692]|uniref:response regulator n=1 Tax=Paenibacillus sp. PAMC21692 TaxID=2762320 RepID=UPI00164CFE67|nr:response regulator [Paenibacillus sp. PAMC21692]QNK57009.1 response regulator [Paenibacillus sp. PAMC21692]